ncbi:MAG: DUF1330 domain-containing protein [Flavisolibacter sp.]|nr:DUF1330 domain-containing protein [Flavisolibacter sp.]
MLRGKQTEARDNHLGANSVIEVLSFYNEFDKKQTMPVYVVNTYDIHDFETFKKYPPRVALLLVKYGAKVLAMDTAPKVLEGTPRMINAIIEFPSEEAVNDFYNDPEYQSFIHLRHNSTSNCTMLMLKQFEKK